MATAVPRYTRVAMLLHWVVAALILANLYLGWRMTHGSGAPDFATFQLHKSIGITVLALGMLRLVWRLLHRPPPFAASLTRWERAAASSVHWAFYALLILLPLTGWIVVSASPLNIPTLLYGTVPLPHLGFAHDRPLPVRLAIGKRADASHVVLAYVTGALLLLHVAAALKHQFWDRDGELYRMIPATDKGRRSAAIN